MGACSMEDVKGSGPHHRLFNPNAIQIKATHPIFIMRERP
jgi:hypothetical protein